MSHTAEEVERLKHAPAVPGVIEEILERWSPRAFSHRAVAGEDLKKIFEAARWAASSYNEQPWRFLVGHRGSETYKKIFDSLDRKSTRLNSSHQHRSRMPSSA